MLCYLVTTQQTNWNLTVQMRVEKTEVKKFLLENYQEDNTQFKKNKSDAKEIGKKSRNGSNKVHRNYRKQVIRSVLKLTLLWKPEFYPSRLETVRRRHFLTLKNTVYR